MPLPHDAAHSVYGRDVSRSRQAHAELLSPSDALSPAPFASSRAFTR